MTNTNIPAIFRVWQIIGKVSPWTLHAGAVACLFPEGSLPARVLRALSYADNTSSIALEVATRRYVASWPMVTSSFVINSVRSFGRAVLDASMPDNSSHVCLWDLDGHLVALTSTQKSTDYRSQTPTDELIRVAVACITADLGASRLYVDRDGLVADSDAFGDHVSEQALSLIEDLRAELATGETCRTVMLVGPPGSGKSTMARQIAAAFAETTVAVDGVALLNGKGLKPHDPDHAEDVPTIVKHCGAQAVVVDDYDRRSNEGESLALIRDLRATAKVVIFTANDIAAFSPAEHRRFNKLVKVVLLDPRTARSIAPDLPESVRDEAWSTLLAAYLHELAVLCRAGRCDPRRALEELKERQRVAEGG